MKQLLILCLALTFSAFSYADDRDLVTKSRQVTRSISANKQYLSQEERRQVRRLLNRILRIVEGDNQPAPTPVPQPPARLSFTGHCELDDDKNFDPGQDVIGTIRGSRVIDLLSECADFARLRYGNSGSYRVSQVNINGRVPRNLQTTMCHIDDDATFDPNQNVYPLAGNSAYEMAEECRSLGRYMFTTSSFRLKQTQLSADSNRYPDQGMCHIDDDRQFDLNQDVFPMAGYSKIELERECSSLANLLYGNNSSWKVIY